MKPNYFHFSDQPNVFTNVHQPKKEHPYLFERPYFVDIIKDLSSWSEFSKFKFYIIDYRNEMDFEFDKESIVFLLSNENHQVPELIQQSLCIFTPYLPYTAVSNIFPIPLGVNCSVPALPVRPIHDREIDIFFTGQINKRRIPFYIFSQFLNTSIRLMNLRRSRANMIKILVSFNRKFATGYTPTEYAEILNNTKIALVPEGYISNVSYRFFEASRAGCIVIVCEQLNSWYMDQFPGIQIKRWILALPRIIKILNDETTQVNMQNRGIEYYNSLINSKRVSSFVIEKVHSLSD